MSIVCVWQKSYRMVVVSVPFFPTPKSVMSC